MVMSVEARPPNYRGPWSRPMENKSYTLIALHCRGCDRRRFKNYQMLSGDPGLMIVEGDRKVFVQVIVLRVEASISPSWNSSISVALQWL